MLEKVCEIAEQAATSVSRRQFLGRIGRGAAATAAVLGGLLALPAVSHAGKKVQTCSLDGPTCLGQLAGSPCSGGKGVCRPCDRSDKSPVVDCCCRRLGGGPKPRR